MLLVMLSFSSTASAFAPPDLDQGIEPARTWHYHAGTQVRLSHQPGWEEFATGEGSGWKARFDERTGTPHVAWGPGIPMGTTDRQEDVVAALRAFVQRNASAFGGVRDDELVVARAVYRDDAWWIDFDRLVDGVPLYRAGIKAVVKYGNLIQLHVDTYPGAHAQSPELGVAEATRRAIAGGPAPEAAHTFRSAREVIVPVEDERGLRLHTAWEIHTDTTEPVGRWVTHVDVGTGEVLDYYDEVHWLSGTIEGMVYPRSVYEDLAPKALALVQVVGDGGSDTFADRDGVYTLSGEDSATVALEGSYCRVKNKQGSDSSTSVDGDLLWTASSDTQQAEISAYTYVSDVHQWCLDQGLSNDRCVEPIVANVNENSSCNAYYDGSTVNFYRAGGGCVNTAEISDVVYHEWGHGLHMSGAGTPGVDGSVSEGVADAVANLQTLDSVIGPGFYVGSTDGIRDEEDDFVYPEDVTGEVHQDGQIVGGAIWDYRKALSDTLGESYEVKGDAWATVGEELNNSFAANYDIPGSFDAFVAVDDDNGDLSDGTPHLCELLESFGAHGLGYASDGAGLVSVDHLAVGNQAAGVSIPIDGSVSFLAAACTGGGVQSATLHFSTDGGATWASTDLSLSGDDFSGELDGFAEGTIVQYYITITAEDGSEASAPTVGSIAPYTFYVGELHELWCSDFDASDEGFTHEVTDGNGSDDDWEWDKPGGFGDDPDSAWSGSRVWGNDLTSSRHDGEYGDGMTNRLTSAPIATTGEGSVILQYRRWLTVEDGYYDHARIYANDAEVWENHASDKSVGDEDTVDDDWILHTLRVDDPGDELTLAWELESDGGKQLGGWTLDDVCVYQAAAAPDDTGSADTGNGGTGGAGDTDGTGTGDGGGSGTDNGELSPKDGPQLAASVCACSTTQPAGTGVLALGLVALTLVRRRTT